VHRRPSGINGCARVLHADERLLAEPKVEGFFGILGKQSLGRTDFHSKRALRDHLDAYMRAWNKSPTPFAWTKPADAIISVEGALEPRK
jgi:hypothetical protein